MTTSCSLLYALLALKLEPFQQHFQLMQQLRIKSEECAETIVIMQLLVVPFPCIQFAALNSFIKMTEENPLLIMFDKFYVQLCSKKFQHNFCLLFSLNFLSLNFNGWRFPLDDSGF